MKFNLYLIKRTILVLSKIISKVKFYPTKPNRPKNPTFILSVLYPFKKLCQYKQFKLKTNTTLKLKTVTALHTIMHSASVFPSGNATTDSKNERHRQVQY